MAQTFKETAHLKTNRKKFGKNYDEIDCGKKEDRENKEDKKEQKDERE